MKCLFVYNPVSGKGTIRKNLEYIKNTLQKKYETVDIYATKCAGDMVQKAKSACGEYDILVFSGGDGSFNEVVQGISNEENRPVLGYLPFGTVNDIAHSLKIPSKLKKALDNVLNGEVKEYDVMKVNDNYAFYVVCAGAFTGCSYMAKQKSKKHLGKIAYVFEILGNELKVKEFPVTLTAGEEKIETNSAFLMFLNSRRVASRPINLKGDLTDGEIDVLMVKMPDKVKHRHKTRAFFRIIHYFLWGLKKCNKRFLKGKKSSYMYFKGSKFRVETDENVVWNFDGERGLSGSINIEVLQKHIAVIVPKKR